MGHDIHARQFHPCAFRLPLRRFEFHYKRTALLFLFNCYSTINAFLDI